VGWDPCHLKAGWDEVRALEVRRDGVRAFEVGRYRVRALEVRRDEVRALEIGRDGVRAPMVGRGGAGAPEVGRDKVDTSGVGRTRRPSPKVGHDRIRALEFGRAGSHPLRGRPRPSRHSLTPGWVKVSGSCPAYVGHPDIYTRQLHSFVSFTTSVNGKGRLLLMMSLIYLA
jgi:hypothetical protein